MKVKKIDEKTIELSMNAEEFGALFNAVPPINRFCLTEFDRENLVLSGIHSVGIKIYAVLDMEAE